MSCRCSSTRVAISRRTSRTSSCSSSAVNASRPWCYRLLTLSARAAHGQPASSRPAAPSLSQTRRQSILVPVGTTAGQAAPSARVWHAAMVRAQTAGRRRQILYRESPRACTGQPTADPQRPPQSRHQWRSILLRPRVRQHRRPAWSREPRQRPSLWPRGLPPRPETRPQAPLSRPKLFSRVTARYRSRRSSNASAALLARARSPAWARARYASRAPRAGAYGCGSVSGVRTAGLARRCSVVCCITSPGSGSASMGTPRAFVKLCCQRSTVGLMRAWKISPAPAATAFAKARHVRTRRSSARAKKVSARLLLLVGACVVNRQCSLCLTRLAHRLQWQPRRQSTCRR